MGLELPVLVDCDYRAGMSCTHPDVTGWTPQTCYQCKLRTVAAMQRGKLKNHPKWTPLPPRTAQQQITHRPIRVGMVTDCWAEGGVEQHFNCLRKYLPKWEFEFTGLGVTSNVDKTVAEYSSGLPAYDHDELMPHVDIVLTWSTDMKNWKDFPGRIVCIAHGADVGENFWVRKWTRRNSAASDILVAVSKLSAAQFPDDQRHRVHVIPNGVDMDRLPTARTPADGIVMGYIGRWSEEKRPGTAARIARSLGGRCVVVIPRAHVAKAKADMDAVGAPYDIWHVERTAEFYATVTATVVCSTSEGYGLVIAEAWASGCPVIATDVGIVPELEAVHGPLVAKVSQEQADTLDTLPEIDPAVVAKAQQVARRECDARTMAAAWADILSPR